MDPDKLQRPKEHGKQRVRESEIQREGEPEKESGGETHEPEGTQEFRPLAARVRTLPEAVQLSFLEGQREKSLFTFARALKAFEITNACLLTKKNMEGAFLLWWQTGTTNAYIPADSDFDEWRFDFFYTIEKTKVPHGGNPLDEALSRARSSPRVPGCKDHRNPKLQLVLAVCYHLSRLTDGGVFFLSVRDAARILGGCTLRHASAVLDGFVHDGVLIQVARGVPGGKRASRFKFARTKTDDSGTT